MPQADAHPARGEEHGVEAPGQHVEQQVEHLRAHAAVAEEQVHPVVQAQEQVPVRHVLVRLARGAEHLDPVAGDVHHDQQHKRGHPLRRVQVRQHGQQTGRAAAVRGHVQDRPERGALIKFSS
eukprot:CAMPEP_0113934928 /NCGR_PEP_ID=MMETSP1339-20121228/2179_1 /TAXON_ID=94617 /ORGANISM="Fibrocapsa japonica" /LENGTH=122 /DNA_ID=CAMNT_0000936909 /DNA_START=384 /DNA_END=752 /DNA_ORIENTATION=- /assembly_acc=CAM_ASM_000762